MNQQIDTDACEQAGLAAYASVFARNGWTPRAAFLVSAGRRRRFLLNQRFEIAAEQFAEIAMEQFTEGFDYQSLAEALFAKAGEYVGYQVHSQEAN
jgi:hypothetical protein